jgi:hypothetical protein
MSAASANVSSKFSVRLEPLTVAFVDDKPLVTATVAALVSSSSEICCVVRVVVPSRIIAAVTTARPGRSAGSKYPPAPGMRI